MSSAFNSGDSFIRIDVAFYWVAFGKPKFLFGWFDGCNSCSLFITISRSWICNCFSFIGCILSNSIEFELLKVCHLPRFKVLPFTTSLTFDNLLLLVILCWFSSNFTIKLLEFKGLVGSHVVIIYTSKGLRLAFSAVSTGSTHEMLVLMLECYIGLLRSHYYFYKLVLLLLVIINWATFEFHLALMFIV